MASAHSDLLMLFQIKNPTLGVVDLDAVNADTGALVSSSGIRHSFPKTNIDKFIGNRVLSVMAMPGESLNDVILKAINTTSLKMVVGVDFSVEGVVTFEEVVSKLYTVPISAGSPAYTGTLAVRVYDLSVASLVNLKDRNFTAPSSLPLTLRVQANLLTWAVGLEDAVFVKGQLGSKWVAQLTERLTTAFPGEDVSVYINAFTNLPVTIFSKDAFSGLAIIRVNDLDITVRYQIPSTLNFVTHVSLP